MLQSDVTQEKKVIRQAAVSYGFLPESPLGILVGRLFDRLAVFLFAA